MRALRTTIVGSLLLATALLTCAAGKMWSGVVVAADHAQLDGADSVIGTDCLPGDHLQTYDGGDLRVRFGSSQVQLGPSADAVLSPAPGAIHIFQLNNGGLRFYSQAGDDLEVGTPAGIVRGVEGQPASGIVVVNSQEVLISATDHALILDNSGELHTIAAGKSYRVEVEQEAGLPQAPQGSGSPNHRRRKLAIFEISVIAAVAFAGAETWNLLSESPSKP